MGAELKAGGYLETPGESGYHFWKPGGDPKASAGLLPKTREGWKLHISGKKDNPEITKKTLLAAMKVLRELGIPHKVMPSDPPKGKTAQDGKGIAAYPELAAHSDYHPDTAKDTYDPSDTKKDRKNNRDLATTRMASVIHLLDSQIRDAHNGNDAKNVPHDAPESESQVMKGAPIYMRYGLCQEKGSVSTFLGSPPRMRKKDNKILTNPDNPRAESGSIDSRHDDTLRKGERDRNDDSKWVAALKNNAGAKALLTNVESPLGVPHWRQGEFLDILTKADGLKRITDSQKLRGVIRDVVEKSDVKTAAPKEGIVAPKGGPKPANDDPDLVIVSEDSRSDSSRSANKKEKADKKTDKAVPGNEIKTEGSEPSKVADPDA